VAAQIKSGSVVHEISSRVYIEVLRVFLISFSLSCSRASRTRSGLSGSSALLARFALIRPQSPSFASRPVSLTPTSSLLSCNVIRTSLVDLDHFVHKKEFTTATPPPHTKAHLPHSLIPLLERSFGTGALRPTLVRLL